MTPNLKPPCAYQSGKQHIAAQIVDIIDRTDGLLQKGRGFCDLCCGSGAVSLELINRGFAPNKIIMCDAGLWGVFWNMVGRDMFDLKVFRQELDTIPDDKAQIKPFLERLTKIDPNYKTVYRFLILQAASLDGKQIWIADGVWRHHSFQDCWQPVPADTQQNKINSPQFCPDKLYARITAIINACRGIICYSTDLARITPYLPVQNSIVYIDPPYPDTTEHACNFDIAQQVHILQNRGAAAVYVSLDRPLTADATQLDSAEPKDGVTKNRKNQYTEWLSRFT